MFAFLLPSFEAIEQKTGYPLEYHGAWYWYGDDELALLHQGFEAAAQLLEGKPENWEVLVGVRQSDPPEKIYETMNKAELENLVAKALEGVEKAQANGKFICFDGDRLPLDRG